MLILWIGISAFVLLVLQYVVYWKFWYKALTVGCRFEKEGMQAGGEGNLLLIVENRKRLPLPMIKVKFSCSRNLKFDDTENGSSTDKYYRNDIFSMMPRQRITRKLHYTCPKRGYYEIGNLDVIGSDAFLSAEWMMEYPSQTSVYVYPNPYCNREMEDVLRRLNGEIATKRRTIEDPFEYRGIRQYQTFDERKSINWKATAKTGSFQVNIKGYTSFQEVRLVLNLEDLGIWKQEELLELSIRITAALARNFLSQGIRVSFVTNGIDAQTGQLISISARAGAVQLDDINRALTMIDLAKQAVPFGESLYPHMQECGQASFPILISKEASDAFQAKISRLLAEKIDFCYICPQYFRQKKTVQRQLMNHYIPIHYEDSV